jgi:hypothetical protein
MVLNVVVIVDALGVISKSQDGHLCLAAYGTQL